jgi:hypothetical protein
MCHDNSNDYYETELARTESNVMGYDKVLRGHGVNLWHCIGHHTLKRIILVK